MVASWGILRNLFSIGMGGSLQVRIGHAFFMLCSSVVDGNDGSISNGRRR